MSDSLRFATATLLTVLLCTACASNPAPPGFVPQARYAGMQAYGSWVSVTTARSYPAAEVSGELVAVDNDTLWVLPTSGGGTAIATRAVRQGQLVEYDARVGELAGAAMLGTLSTISNGAFLIFTAPAWMISGAVATGRQSRLPIADLPPKVGGWESLAKFARFPHGLPPGIDLKSLRPKR